MIAMRLAWLMARWAFMKTRRLARVVERVRVEWRSAQALGFVSRIIVRREGGGSGEGLVGVERGGRGVRRTVGGLAVVVGAVYGLHGGGLR